MTGQNVAFLRVTSDSRTLVPGDLFVALAGDRFDGHDYVAQAIGAAPWAPSCPMRAHRRCKGT